jgi:hypothetical protein
MGSLGPRADTLTAGNKKLLGPSRFKFLGLAFSVGPGFNRLGPRSLGPRFLNFGVSRFLGNLGSLGPRTGALFGPRDETGDKKIGGK